MSPGNRKIALALAKASLEKEGIKHPTRQQLRGALVGDAKHPGILKLRAQGMGWGQVAHSLGFKLGEVMRPEKHRAKHGHKHDRHHAKHEHKHDRHHAKHKHDRHHAKHEHKRHDVGHDQKRHDFKHGHRHRHDFKHGQRHRHDFVRVHRMEKPEKPHRPHRPERFERPRHRH